MTTIRFKSPEQKARATAWLLARRLHFKSMGPGLLAVEEASLALLKEQRLMFLAQGGEHKAESSDESDLGSVGFVQ